MQLSAVARQVHTHLTAAAALGDERTREIAAALAVTADSAVRVAILDALTVASSELADTLAEAAAAHGVAWAPEVSVRLDGDWLGFAIAAQSPAMPPPAEPVSERPEDGEATARISLRLPESLKAGIERSADRAEVSVNSWLVRAATAALQAPAAGAEDRGNWAANRSNRVSGWITG